MTDKTRKEFEAWVKSAIEDVDLRTVLVTELYYSQNTENLFAGFEGAWQHQRAVIDAKDAEIARLRASRKRIAIKFIKARRECARLLDLMRGYHALVMGQKTVIEVDEALKDLNKEFGL